MTEGGGLGLLLWERAQKMEGLKTARPVIVAIVLPAETHLLEENIRQLIATYSS
jgi:hypothetical protein